MSHDFTEEQLQAAARDFAAYMRGEPSKPVEKKLRPNGWAAQVAAKRVEARLTKLADRATARRRRQLAPQMELGQPFQILNRWTGKPHEHARAKARRLRQIGAS